MEEGNYRPRLENRLLREDNPERIYHSLPEIIPTRVRFTASNSSINVIKSPAAIVK
jgi:hypothetical protein